MDSYFWKSFTLSIVLTTLLTVVLVKLGWE